MNKSTVQRQTRFASYQSLIASGTDLTAITGDLSLTAGGTVALLAGQDTLSQESATVTVTNPNIFSKQQRTLTDSYNSLNYQGSTAQGNKVTVSSGADIVLQAAQITAGEGGISLDAGRDIKLLAAMNSTSSKQTEKLKTDGFIFRADGSLDDLSDRSKNKQVESQKQTADLTRLVSAGDITTRSARDTLIEASVLEAKGAIDLSAGKEATYNRDGSIKSEAIQGRLTIAAVKDTDYLSIEDKHKSMPWQSQSGSGRYTETIKLANIKAGKGLSTNATGGIFVDIPDVPAPEEVARPEAETSYDEQGNPQEKPQLTPEQTAVQAAEAAAQTAQAALQKKHDDEQRFNDHINKLATKPGQEWIGQLANLAKDKPDSATLQRVAAAAQHWDYKAEGLTREAAIVIAIVVAYFTAGAGSSLVGTATATAGTTTAAVGGTTLATTATTTAGVSVTTYTVAGAAINAGISTLASQAAVTLINNKGDVGKTLEELGKSENVRNIVAAMLTAGVGTAMPSTSMTGVLAQTATGCTTGEMVGIGCESGATNAAVTSGAALAYTTMVGYAADLRPGENRNGLGQNDATYVPDKNPNSPTFGQQLPADRGMNVIGLNRPDSILSQGGAMSNALNKVPFVNAAAGWHDYIFNASPLLNDWFTVVNVPAMIPAAMLAIPASLNDPSVSWLFINGLPHTLDTPPKPPVIPSIISLPNTVLEPVLSVSNQEGRP